MSVKNTYVRYGVVAMTFHWIIAFLIILNVGLGIYFVQFLDRHDPMRGVVVNTHKSIGITVLILSLLRLGWRLMNPNSRTACRFLADQAHSGARYSLHALRANDPGALHRLGVGFDPQSFVGAVP